MVDLHNLIQEGQLDKAKELQHRLITPNAAVSTPVFKTLMRSENN